MRYTIFVDTPAHAHTYRNFVAQATSSGDEVLVLARDYACTLDILDYHDVDYTTYGGHDPSRYSVIDFATGLPGQFARVAWHVRRFDPDIVLGRGPSAAFAGTICSAKVVLLRDAEPDERLHKVSSRLADLVITPAAADVDLGADHYPVEGFRQCGYLLPETFTPDPSVRADLGVASDDQLVVVRFDSPDALHRRDEDGHTDADRQRIVDRLSERATVLVADESGTVDLTGLDATRFDLHPARTHDVLATADLLVAGTGTMVTEAAFVGTPTVGFGEFVEQESGEFVAIEAAGLVRTTTDLQEVVAHSLSVLDADEDAERRYQRRRRTFLDGLVDLNDVLATVAGDLDRAARHGDQSVTRSRRTRHVAADEPEADRAVEATDDPGAGDIADPQVGVETIA